jgi:hypothetical protein
MLNNDGELFEKIEGSLDESFIMHEISHGVFDLTKTLLYIGQTMLELCASVRDSSIRALQSMNNAEVIVEMQEILQEMTLDLSNYRLKAVRPHLIQQAVEYERAKFDEALESGRVNLNRTSEWIKKSYTELKETIQSRDPENIANETPKFVDVIHTAYLSLLFQTEIIDNDIIPETLQMDLKRFNEWQNEIQALAIVSAICMLCRNTLLCFRNESEMVFKLKDALLILLQESGTNCDTISSHIIKVANASLNSRNTILAAQPTIANQPRRN